MVLIGRTPKKPKKPVGSGSGLRLVRRERETAALVCILKGFSVGPGKEKHGFLKLFGYDNDFRKKKSWPGTER